MARGGSRLVALEPYQPYFVATALAFFGFALHSLYRRPEACAPGEACALPAARHRQRIILWVVSALATTLMSFSLYAPPFY